MKFWLLAPWTPVEEMVELAQFAETLGFEGIMGADHAFVPENMAPNYPYANDGKAPIHAALAYPDVWTTLTAIAAVTKKLRLSTAVYVLPLRHPVEVAKATANLATFSSNRLVLGAGVGWMKEEFDAYGIDFHSRGRRTDEILDLLPMLWHGGTVSHQGEFFNLPPLRVTPTPSAQIPIYIGGSSEAALGRAARSGDGWIGTGNSTTEASALLDRIHSLRERNGRLDEPFDNVVTLTDFSDIGAVHALQDKGMTSLVFGFGKPGLPMARRKQQMEQFARYIMDSWVTS